MINLEIERIISLYDDKRPEDKEHVSSINGILGEEMAAGILGYYFKEEERVENVKILDYKPTQGIRNGKRLDRWICVNSGGSNLFYQTEIKNWGSHSYGAQKVILKDIKEYAIRSFAKQWADGNMIHKDVKKVLLSMKKPKEFKPGDRILPLICFWFPICKNATEEMKPLFETGISTPESTFDNLYFFSLSIYLRQLLEKGTSSIDIKANKFEKRMQIINECVNG